MSPPPTPPAPMVWPTFRARDAHAMIRYLTEAVGFRVAVVHGDDTVVHHSELLWPLGGGVMVGSVRPGAAPLAGPGEFSCYVVTDDADALCERVRRGGGEITDEPATTAYGSREFAMRDPEGNHWYFGTYAGAGTDS